MLTGPAARATPKPRVTERGIVPLDTHKLREKALKACATAAKAFEQDDRALKDFEQGDGSGAENHWRKHTELVEKGLRDWGPASQVIDLLDN